MASIPLRILGICSALFKCNYLKKGKLFLKFLLHLWNVHQLSNIFKKKMIVIANVFPKLQTVKYLVKPPSRKLLFRTSFENQRINGYRTVVKSAREHFYHIFSSFWGEVIWKSSALLKFEILLAIGNTLTAGDKYPVWDCDNLQFPIQMQISWKKNFFRISLFNLWNLHQVLNNLEKKMMVTANVFVRLQTIKAWLDHSLESSVSKPRSTVNVLMGTKQLWKLHDKTFINFFYHSEGKWLGRYLPYWNLKS